MKFIEFGIGNKWIIRTEIELSNGQEVEEKGIVRPIHFHSIYIRIWIRRTVLIFESKQGFKRMKKSRNEFKFIIGIVSM
ncbi:DUF3977 family protein [Mesobacillus zeae]|uniref:DUF3977 family protein n=1 Tax=Mesobacillus zeae TaxID=1917180 RepID=UPI00300908A7